MKQWYALYVLLGFYEHIGQYPLALMVSYSVYLVKQTDISLKIYVKVTYSLISWRPRAGRFVHQVWHLNINLLKSNHVEKFEKYIF